MKLPRFALLHSHAWRLALAAVTVLLLPDIRARGQETAPQSGLALAAAMEQALADAIAKCEPSVVSVARVRRDGQDAAFAPDGGEDAFARSFGAIAPQPDDPNFIPNEFGAGVVIDADGFILTCYHVLREDCDHWVTLPDRRVFAAKIVGADPRSDLAILRIDAKGLKPIPLGDGGAVKKGQIVIALGNPYAIARDGQVSASWGIVSNLGRKSVPPSAAGTDSGGALHQYGNLIQTDARLDLGASGGPLINLSGEMVGLTTALAALSGHESGVGFALPVDAIFRRAVETMIPGREVQYGLLGVIPENLSARDRADGLRGVVVSAVSAGTPAAKAGLEAADWITAVDGALILDTDDLMLKLGKYDAGAPVTLKVNRNGREFDAQVQLAKFFVRDWKLASAPPRAWRGMQVDYANAVQGNSVFEELGPVVDQGCVVVTAVKEASPAWEAGFRRGDFIAQVAEKNLTTPDEFFAAVDGANGPVNVRLPAATVDNPLRVVREDDK